MNPHLLQTSNYSNAAPTEEHHYREFAAKRMFPSFRIFFNHICIKLQLRDLGTNTSIRMKEGRIRTMIKNDIRSTYQQSLSLAFEYDMKYNIITNIKNC